MNPEHLRVSVITHCYIVILIPVQSQQVVTPTMSVPAADHIIETTDTNDTNHSNSTSSTSSSSSSSSSAISDIGISTTISGGRDNMVDDGDNIIDIGGGAGGVGMTTNAQADRLATAVPMQASEGAVNTVNIVATASSADSRTDQPAI
jgi:hypothetical protein